MLFSEYFLIIYLIYINVHMLIAIPSIIPPVSGGHQALQVHRGGTLPATCPQLPQPQDTPALDPKLIMLQEYDTSPGHCVLREIESLFLFWFCCFYLIIWTRVHRWMTVLWVAFFPSTTTSFTSINPCWVSFHIGYYRVWNKCPCVMQWILVIYFINSSVQILVWSNSFLHAPHLYPDD